MGELLNRMMAREALPLWGLAAVWVTSLLVVGLVVAWWRAKQPPPPPVYHLTLDPLATPPTGYDWTHAPEPAFPIPPYARHLAGVKLVIDPGHGGRASRRGWKSGPTGLREEVVNLRVALYLREFLEAVGADVVLTRTDDVYLAEADADDLRLRAELANRHRADLLLSIHHNAADNPAVNHTLVFYHDTPDHSPASLAAARHLLAGLGEALRLPQHSASPLVSDKTIHANNGFALLRQAEVPAVLSEASFFTNPDEEQRLRDPAYNRREAYGLFVGLARWAHAGLPRVRLYGAELVRPGGVVTVALDDGLSGRPGVPRYPKIVADSLVVRLDGRPVVGQYDAAAARLAVPLGPEVGRGRHELRVDFTTLTGQHVLHPRLAFEVGE